jgi:hypothetical protein
MYQGEKLKRRQWMLIALGADALTGGAISLTAVATATATSAVATSTAATVATTATAMVTNTATSLVTAYNTALISLPAVQSTAMVADFTVGFTDFFFTNNTKRLENFFKIAFGSFLHQFFPKPDSTNNFIK